MRLTLTAIALALASTLACAGASPLGPTPTGSPAASLSSDDGSFRVETMADRRLPAPEIIAGITCPSAAPFVLFDAVGPKGAASLSVQWSPDPRVNYKRMIFSAFDGHRNVWSVLGTVTEDEAKGRIEVSLLRRFGITDQSRSYRLQVANVFRDVTCAPSATTTATTSIDAPPPPPPAEDECDADWTPESGKSCRASTADDNITWGD